MWKQLQALKQFRDFSKSNVCVGSRAPRMTGDKKKKIKKINFILMIAADGQIPSISMNTVYMSMCVSDMLLVSD